MPRSQAEVRAAHATLEGADTGMSRAYAAEVVEAMHGKSMASLPQHTAGAEKSKSTPAVKSTGGPHWSGK